MTPVFFDSAQLYLESSQTLADKVRKIDDIILALEAVALKAADREHISEYTLNDGQTTIRANYNGALGVLKAIEGYEALRQMYLNRLNGRMVRLVPGTNFTRRC